MNWAAIWRNLFGTVSLLGIDMGFWVGMASAPTAPLNGARINPRVLEGQFFQDGDVLVFPDRIFTGDMERPVAPAFNLVFRQISGCSLRAFGQKKKFRMGTLTHDFPRFLPPLVKGPEAETRHRCASHCRCSRDRAGSTRQQEAVLELWRTMGRGTVWQSPACKLKRRR